MSDHDSLLYGDFKGTGGQYCDVCDSNNPAKNHSIEFVKDGTERWWQSPPLSSNTHTRDLNKVNITIDMHQVIFSRVRVICLSGHFYCVWSGPV